MKFEVGIFVLSAISGLCVWGQTNGSGSTPTGTKSAASVSSTSTFTLSGTVRIDDGSTLPGSASIQLVCSGAERTVAHTSLLDDFGFQMIASGASSPGAQISYSPLNTTNADARAGSVGTGLNQAGCDLRADLPGYSSSVIRLNSPTAFDGSDVGVIWLHRVIKKPVGNMISVSTVNAPKEARKSFDKGVELLRDDRLQDAAVSFEAALRIDPGFAEAWLNLGRCRYRMRSIDAAKTSLAKALTLDPRMPGTWQTLGYIASDQQDWATAVRDLDEAERLDPLDSPLPWFFSAMAYYHLHRFPEAERSIRQEIALDTRLQYPRSQYLLALILIARQDVDGGSAALRNYLALAPDPHDVATANAILNRVSAKQTASLSSR